MNQIFPYANIFVGILVFIVGFVFHWAGQLISIINWDYATKIGLQEKGQPKEFKVYEHAIAKADVFLGWIYGVAGVLVMLDIRWGYQILWFPGAVLIYHAISFWYWTANQQRIGFNIVRPTFRVI